MNFFVLQTQHIRDNFQNDENLKWIQCITEQLKYTRIQFCFKIE